MEGHLATAPWAPKNIFTFICHQFVGTWGVAIAATLAVSISFGVLNPVAPSIFNSGNRSWLLTSIPYFPVQMGSGLWAGLMLGRWLRHRSMIWVWVLPALLLSYAVIAVPTLTPDQTSIIVQAGVGRSALAHYFGRGCNPRDRCVDQIIVTMPFYCSVCYSAGAFVAGAIIRRRSRALEATA
jgi:hypothetical protein